MVTVIPKVVTSQYHRTRLPITLYIMSILMSTFLILLTTLYCHLQTCQISSLQDNDRHILQNFPLVAAPIILFISFTWLGTACMYPNNNCSISYNFMEMPSAVFCSLIAGISAVIEVHFEVQKNLAWSEQWVWSAVISLCLCLLHAMVAFALQ